MHGKVAFTLAEVLITLGIIGVVAAMTLPGLIANYQKQVYVNQLKKGASILSQGFTTMMGREGVAELKDTDAFGGMQGACNTTQLVESPNCESMKKGLYEIFANIEIKQTALSTKYLDGRRGTSVNDYVIQFPDGSYLLHFQFENMDGYVAKFEYDVNGGKNPNQLGRDIFMFYLGNNGQVYPVGSEKAAEMTCIAKGKSLDKIGNYYWKTASSDMYTCDPNGTSYGSGCTARIFEEGKMDY